MTKTTKKKKDKHDSKKADKARAGTHEKVPEGAENMEHTLRRLVTEKAKRREKDPGLYY